MKQTSKTIATLISLATAIAVFIFITAGFFILSYQHFTGSLESEAEMCAGFLTNRIKENRLSWIRDPEIVRLLQLCSVTDVNHRRSIRDLEGNVLKEHRHELDQPELKRVHDLSDGYGPVARLEIARSLRQLILSTGLVALLALILSIALFFLLRALPLRAVRRAEDSLLQSEYRYRTLFEESKDAIIIASPEGTILDANSAAVVLFGYDSRESIAAVRHVSDLFADQEDLRSRIFSLLEGHGALRDYDFSCVTRDGRKICGVMSVVEVKDRREERTTYNLFCRDQTAQKMIEQQLLHSQKMEAVGVLAGGVAHDFNSILTIIGGFAEILQKRVSREDQLREYVDGLLAATKRAAHLVKGLLTFSRNDPVRLQPVNISRMMHESGKMLSVLLGDTITLILSAGDEEMTVMADRELLHQVLMNLVTNARDAMPHGGTLSISSFRSRIDESFVTTHGFGATGNYATIAIRDTGEGMPEEVVRKIFEPFFTTKEVGRGTGLGLSIVYGIIKQHNGFVVVRSEPGSGTEFIIYLPLPEQVPKEPE